MKELRIDQSKIETKDLPLLVELCPFGAIEIEGERAAVNSGCRMCGLCVKRGPDGAFRIVEVGSPGDNQIDKSLWQGIAVYIEQEGGHIHPVSFELIGKARELAEKIGERTVGLFIGSGIGKDAERVLAYGLDDLFLFDQPELEDFRIEPYTAAFEAFITELKPGIVLVGGTVNGRSLAPRIAARCRTGLTADCTLLDVQSDGDLDQIRPAFGGNIMAHIRTPRHRPQFATVRYRIFDAPELQLSPSGKIHQRSLNAAQLASKITIRKVEPKQKELGIEDAEIIVVAGRGIKKGEDLSMVEELAQLLGGMVAGTRSLIEAGLVDPKRQIGLSGRTVKPRLIITCGVSGAIQFVAGMNASEHIIAINTDPEAPIMKVAHIGIVGDLYEVLPRLIRLLKAGCPLEAATA